MTYHKALVGRRVVHPSSDVQRDMPALVTTLISDGVEAGG
jgi:hypothetical protein